MQSPGAPAAPNLTSMSRKGWNKQAFLRAMRTGILPSGKSMHPIMPWQQLGQMSDQELQAIWVYMQSVSH